MQYIASPTYYSIDHAPTIFFLAPLERAREMILGRIQQSQKLKEKDESFYAVEYYLAVVGHWVHPAEDRDRVFLEEKAATRHDPPEVVEIDKSRLDAIRERDRYQASSRSVHVTADGFQSEAQIGEVVYRTNHIEKGLLQESV